MLNYSRKYKLISYLTIYWSGDSTIESLLTPDLSNMAFMLSPTVYISSYFRDPELVMLQKICKLELEYSMASSDFKIVPDPWQLSQNSD